MGTAFSAAFPVSIKAAIASRTDISYAVIISDLCPSLDMLLHLHELGVHPGVGLGLLFGLVAGVPIHGTNVVTVLIAAGPVIKRTTPVSVAHLAGTRVAHIRIIRADIGTVLLTASEVRIGAAPVTRAHHSWTVIIICDLCTGPGGGDPLLHLLDQGKHLGIASGPSLLGMASLCSDGQHGHKAERKS